MAACPYCGVYSLDHHHIIDEAEFEQDRLMLEPGVFYFLVTMAFLFLNHDFPVDPSTICAFCDQPWPKEPSKELMDLYARIRQRAKPQPRFGNARGLRAPMKVFIDMCVMHRNETTVIPEGLAQGWPSKIDFDAIPHRLWKLKSKLEKIIDCPASGYFYEMAKTDIEENGILSMSSIQGQFKTFQKTQPG
jgi:hypothetical protein